MESILYNISQVLGITIVHSLWQGLLIYFALRIIFTSAPSLSAIKKYNLAIAALMSTSFWFIYTLFFEIQTYSWVKLSGANVSALLPYLNLPVNAHQFSNHSSYYYAIARYMPYVSVFYMAGLTANLIKLGHEWSRIKQIKRSLIPAEQMQQYINSIAKTLGITKSIRVKFSNLIDVPCITGYLKPIIFLPVSIATSLTACEIESILLHELSHIKRKDYLVNLVQQFITIMLFFNPFAQLINRIINRERENGCDDMVIERTENPLIYAHALLKLEETRQQSFELTLSATGKRYHLLNRIERIMKTNQPTGNIRHLLITILLLAGSLSCIAWFNPKVNGKKEINTTIVKPVIAPVVMPIAQPIVTISYVPIIAKAKIVKLKLISDTNRFVAVTDTNKHNKVKVEKADTVNDSFNGPEWRAQMEVMRKQGEELRKQFNSPEWRSQMDAMRKQSEEMRKQFKSPEWKSQMDAMRKQGELMKKQFDNPQWKNQMLAMRKQGEEMKKQFDSPEWRSQMDAMKKQSDEMKKQFDSPEWRSQMDAMRKQGEEMRKQFDSPEWKKQMKDINKQGIKIKKEFKAKKWYLKDTVNNIYMEKPERSEKKEAPVAPEKEETQPVN